MVALRRTETYQTIRHHLRDTVIYDWLRTHTVFTYMFHLTPEGELFFRTPAPDTHIYDTPEGILTPPPQHGAPLIPMNTERHRFQSDRTVTGRPHTPFPLYVEDFTDGTRNIVADRRFPHIISDFLLPYGQEQATKTTWKQLENVWNEGVFNQSIYQQLSEPKKAAVKQAAAIFHQVHRMVAAVFYEGVKHDVLPTKEWYTTLWGTVFSQVRDDAITEFNNTHQDLRVTPGVFTNQLTDTAIAFATTTVDDDYTVRFDPDAYIRFWGFVFDVLNLAHEPLVNVLTRTFNNNWEMEIKALVIPLEVLSHRVLSQIVTGCLEPVGEGLRIPAAAAFTAYGLTPEMVHHNVTGLSVEYDNDYWEIYTGKNSSRKTMKITPSSQGSFATCEITYR